MSPPRGHRKCSASWGSVDLLEGPGKILGFGASQVWVYHPDLLLIEHKCE